MSPSIGLFEIQVGVYATAQDVTSIVERCRLTLGQRVPWQLGVVDEQSARPGGMPLTEFYDELPQQWSDEHPGVDPGQRRIHEIRVGVVASRGEADSIQENLLRVLCPDPDHRSPCPVPWSTSCSDAADDCDRRADLEERYAGLRRR